MPCVRALIDHRAVSVSQKGLNTAACLIYLSEYVQQLVSPNKRSRDEAGRRVHEIVDIFETKCSEQHEWAHQVDMASQYGQRQPAPLRRLTDCVELLPRARFNRKQQCKLHFYGCFTSHYHSISACMSQQGTPLEVVCRAEVYLASLGSHRIPQQGRSVGLCTRVSTDGLTSVCRQRLHSMQVFSDKSVVVRDLMFGYSVDECSHRAEVHVVSRISR